MRFTTDEIKRIVSESKNYSLIWRMVDYEIVDRFVMIENTFTYDYEITANITSYERSYKCTITADKYGEVDSYHCPCPYCTSESACAHIGILMAVVNQQNPEVFPYYYEKDKAEDFETRHRRFMLKQQMWASQRYLEERRESAMLIEIQQQQQEKISVTAYLQQGNNGYDQEHYGVSFKIGAKRMYMIKNLREFIKNVVMQRETTYGKGLKTNHSKNNMTASSALVIQFIQDALFLQDEYHETTLKEISLYENTIDHFYEVFSDQANIPNTDFMSINLAEHKIKLKCTKENGLTSIALENPVSMIYGKQAMYSVVQSAEMDKYLVIKYNVNQQREVIDFMKQIDAKGLLVEEAALDDFNRYVYHNIKGFFDIDENALQSTVLDNRLELYGDLDQEGFIVFRIKAYADETLLNQSFKVLPSASLNFLRIKEVFHHFAGEFGDDEQIVKFSVADDSTGSFIHDGIETLKTYAVIYISDALKRMRLSSRPVVQVGLSFTNNLLHVDLTSEGIPKEELQDVLHAYRRKKKFYRLKNGEMIILNEGDFDDVEHFLEKLGRSAKDIEQGSVAVNPYRIFSLDNLAHQFPSFTVDSLSSFSEQLHSMQTINAAAFQLPAGVHAELRNYQIEGYQWLRTLHHYGFGGILADDMGLGKTLQMITYFASFPDETQNLVVCPSSVLLNWEQEVLRFAPDLRIITINGPKQQRLQQMEHIMQANVVIISYDYLRRDCDTLKEIEFDCVVLDEAQYIKNHTTQNFRSVKQLKAKQRFALTGTPIENSLAELWSIFDFLMPEYLYPYAYFKKNYESPIIKENDEAVSSQLKQLVKPFILRRLKSEVLHDLPTKTEVNMLVEFSEEERRLYYANLAQVNEDLRELTNQQASEIQILAMLTRLRRLCCEPRTVYENIDHYSSKLAAVLSFVQDLIADGKKILLFSSFTSVLDLIAEAMDKEGITYNSLDGRVSKEKRQTRIAAFQAGTVDVFLISLRAGGTGINLTAAEVVIHFDPWWNISAQNQATDRAYRIGQQNNVLVYKFIMKGSIEEKIQHLQNQKKLLSDTFVEDSDGSITVMNKEEIISLFSMDD